MNEKFVQPGDGIEVVSKAGPIRERIMALLKDAAEGLDDDRLTMNLGLSHRQQVSAICRDLVQKGLVERRSVAGKIRNFLGFARRQTEAGGVAGREMTLLKRSLESAQRAESVETLLGLEGSASATHFKLFGRCARYVSRSVC